MKKKRIIQMIGSLMIVLLIATIVIIALKQKKEMTEFVSVKSKRNLERIYKNEVELPISPLNILTFPFFMISSFSGNNHTRGEVLLDERYTAPESKSIDSVVPEVASFATELGSAKEYSTTNVQVENVDEADVIKTDGDYIYSLSDMNVIISDVRNPEETKIVSKIELRPQIPEELILYKDKLVVISSKQNTNTPSYEASSYIYYSSARNTVVTIYDIANRQTPKEIKSYELLEPYYTSRCIDDKLYVIANRNT